MKITCPVCLGSGLNPEYQLRPYAPSKCSNCQGSGEVDSTDYWEVSK